LGLFIFCLVLISGTRSAWVSVIFSMMCLPVMLWLRGWRPTRFQTTGLVSVLVILGLGLNQAAKLPGISAKVDQTLSVLTNPTREGLDQALSLRLGIWEDAVAVGASSPVIGTGVNNFRFAQPLLPNPSMVWSNSTNPEKHALQGPSHTHQIFLEAWSGAGAAGVMGLIILFSAVTVTSLKSFKAGNLAAIAALLAFWAGFLPLNTHNNFYGGWLTAWFWIWIGLSAGFVYRNGLPDVTRS